VVADLPLQIYAAPNNAPNPLPALKHGTLRLVIRLATFANIVRDTQLNCPR
jgi:hypothetical protein